MARPFVVPEVAVARAGRHDQVVVADRALHRFSRHRRAATSIASASASSTRTFGGMPEDPADRRRDVAGRQRRGRHLVEQRLEEMVVMPIEQRDAHPFAAQDFRGREPAESAADDHDASGSTLQYTDGERMKTATSTLASEHNVATVCPLDCPDSCSLDVTVQDGRITDDRRLARRTRSRAATSAPRCGAFRSGCTAPIACSIRPSARDRKGWPAFTRVTWDDALGTIAERMRDAREQWGGESILPYSYGGSNGLLTQDTSDATLFRRLGASRLARTVCAAPTGAANLAMYGKMASVVYQDVPEAKAIVLWGANPSASGIHLVPYIREAQRRGARADRDRSAHDAAGQAGRHSSGRPPRHRSAGGARNPPLSVRGRARGHRVPRRAHARARIGCANARCRGRSNARRPKPGIDADRLRAAAEAYAAATPRADPLRLGTGAQPQRRQRVDGHPGAAGGRRKVRRARRRLHDEQLGIVGHHAPWIGAAGAADPHRQHEPARARARRRDRIRRSRCCSSTTTTRR